MNKPKKIFVIVQEDGDLYCAAMSQELADQIIAEDTAKGDLQPGAFVTDLNFFQLKLQRLEIRLWPKSNEPKRNVDVMVV